MSQNIPPSIEQIMYGNYIKYDSLKRLTIESLGYSSSDKLHIYIDVYSIILPLLRSRVTIGSFSNITSSIINLCAHLKSYYMNAHRVDTDFYIVFSLNCPTSARGYYNNYNFKMTDDFIKNKHLFSIIKENSNLLNILCPYLPNIYFIEDNNTEAAVIIHDLINKNKCIDNNTVPHMILSKDIYMYQVVAMNDNTVIFRPAKDIETKMDISYYIDRSNIYNMYRTHASKSKPTRTYDGILSPELFSLVLSMSNLSCRNIYILQNFNTVMTLLENCVLDKRINNAYTNDIDYLLTLIPNNKEKCPDYFVSARFKALDLLFQHYIYTNSVNYNMISGNIVNLYDPDAVREINNKYFVENPLDLNRL